MKNSIYHFLSTNKEGKKKTFAVLIDPDKLPKTEELQFAEQSGVDLFLVGGSLITQGNLSGCISFIKKHTTIPVLIFPGDQMQVSEEADGILLLSLISGRNPELLIGKHVLAAPRLKQSRLEIIPTGYMLIESGKITSAQYMSGTVPLPRDKPELAECTAIAGEMLGLKLIYMDAGSGALHPVSPEIIRAVKKQVQIPLIVGGGIDTAEKAKLACDAGADVLVVGNIFEKDPQRIRSIADTIHSTESK